jgi:pentatricopeptide repeat protein
MNSSPSTREKRRHIIGEFTDAYNEIALYYVMTGDMEKAVEFGEKYVSMSLGIANSYDSLASIYLIGGKLEDALASWKKAIDKDPNFYLSYESLVHLCALKEDFPAAMNWIDRLLERNLGHGIKAEAFGLRAFLELWLGRFQQSLADFDRAAEFARAVGNVHLAWYTEYYKAAAYCEMGNYEVSKKFYQAAYDSSEKVAGGQTALTKQELAYNLAWNDLMLGRLDTAKLRLEEIKAPLPGMMASFSWRIPGDELFKKKIDYLYEFLKSEIAIGEGRADLESLRRTFADSPDFISPESALGLGIMAGMEFLHFPPPLVKDILARAYVQKGELDKAIAVYERMITFDTKSKDRRWIHPLTHYRLAKAYDQAGRKDKARASYKKFLEFWKDADPGRPEVEDAQKRLAALSR